MKVAYRTASPQHVLFVEASISKVSLPSPHLLLTAADGGSRVVSYSDFADLTAEGVSIEDYNGAAPAPFRPDQSHTWNGSALLATDYVFPDPEPLPVERVELTFGAFQDLCYNDVDGGALGRVAEPEGTVWEQFLAGGARYGAIVQGVEADQSQLGKAAHQRYMGGMTSGFVYAKTITFLVMISALLEPGELDAIVEAWPKKR